MKDVTNLNLTIVENTLLPAIEQELTVVQVDDHYELENFESLKQLVTDWIDSLDQYEYHEDDRKMIKKLKATSNKLITSTTQTINAQTQLLIGTAQAQKTELNSLLTQLSSKLSLGVDEEDKRFKREKRIEISDKFDDYKKDFKSLADTELDLDDVFVNQWLNRSKGMNVVEKELYDRMSQVNFLVESPTSPTTDIYEIVDALDDTSWSGLMALNELIHREELRQEKLIQEKLKADMEKQRQQEEADRKAAQEGKELATRIVDKLPDVLVKIAGEDIEKAENLLRAGGVKFVRI